MTRLEFIGRLSRALGNLPIKEREEILSDFSEHFSLGEQDGKTEEQICEDLGTPEDCAKQYLSDDTGSTTPKAPPFHPYAQPGSTRPQPNPVYQQRAAYAAAPGVQVSYHAGTTPPPVNVTYTQPKTDDRAMYVVLLILAILFLALPVYPMAAGLLAGSIAVFTASFVVFPISGFAVVGCLLIALSVFLLSLGILLALAVTQLLVTLVRHITGKPNKKEA